MIRIMNLPASNDSKLALRAAECQRDEFAQINNIKSMRFYGKLPGKAFISFSTSASFEI
jgi:hypothetical protein